MTRTINAPGHEIREIDRSQYNRTVDNSLANAPVNLILGYSDYGVEYSPQLINTIKTFTDIYGYPTTDIERWFYGAVEEVINRRGICIAAKVPYEDQHYKKHYAYTTYKLNESKLEITDSNKLKAIKTADDSITSYFDIENSTDVSATGKISFDELNSLLNGSASIAENTLKIIDISHGKYTRSQFNCIYDNVTSSYTNDCLGIVPVVVSPANALYFKEMLSSDACASCYNCIANIGICSSDLIPKTISADMSKFNDNCYIKLSSDLYYDLTVSKSVSELFPQISIKSNDRFDRNLLKCIGIVVLKPFVDVANDNKINFSVVESFSGCISREIASKSNNIQYIEDAVNNNSNYIRVFANFDLHKKKTIGEKEYEYNLLETADILNITNQTATSLGFFERECEKKLGKPDQIYNSVKDILSKMTNTNAFPIDIVIDAGMTNVIEYANWKNKREVKPTEEKREQWSLDSTTDTTYWSKMQNLYDNFCRTQRKDCIFVSDCLRTLCLCGNLKLVRNYTYTSILKDILPKLKFVKHIDSSYSIGYCNWYQVRDTTNSEVYYWQPPSIKAAGVMNYCDTYCNVWDAPAGISRATLTNIVDIAFNPSQKEAENFYNACWNYAVRYPTYGIVVEGLKTFQTEQTALDRINVRRLLLWLERQTVRIVRQYLYLPNTTYVRNKLLDALYVPFETAKNGNGLSEYAIKCDSENNTDNDIDNNELHVKIAIKPIKTIEYVVLDFIITNQYATVSEEIMK